MSSMAIVPEDKRGAEGGTEKWMEMESRKEGLVKRRRERGREVVKIGRASCRERG
mgnify:CR=1 FL=1